LRSKLLLGGVKARNIEALLEFNREASDALATMRGLTARCAARIKAASATTSTRADGQTGTRCSGTCTGRDFLQVVRPKSHVPPARIWEQQRAQAAQKTPALASPHPDESAVPGDDGE
jgi:hypothetical protein